MPFEVFCGKCKITYTIGIIKALLKGLECPICHKNQKKLRFGKLEEIR